MIFSDGSSPAASPVAFFLGAGTRIWACLAVLFFLLPLLGLGVECLSRVVAGAAWELPSLRALGVLCTSVGFSLSVALAAIALGFFVAAGLQKKAWMPALLPALLILPFSIQSLTWAMVGIRLGGVFSQGWTAAFFAEMLAFLPLGIGIGTVALATLDEKLLEAAQVFRRNGAVFWQIALPLIAPVLLAGSGAIFLFSVLDFTIPSIFGCSVYSLEIYAAYSATGNPLIVALLSLPLIVLACVCLPILARMAFRAIRLTPPTQQTLFFVSPAWQTAALVTLGAFLLVPIVSLMADIGTVATFFRTLLDAQGEIVESLWTASIAASLCVLAGFPLALVCASFPSLRWVLVAISLPLALPPPLIGMGLLQCAKWMPYDAFDSWLPVFVAVTRFFPLAGWICFAMLQRIDVNALEAAAVFQPSKIRGFCFVLLPLSRRALGIVWLVSFALSLGELGASLLVIQPGHSLLMVRIYNLLHYGAAGDVAALGLFLQAIALLAGIAAVLLGKSLFRR